MTVMEIQLDVTKVSNYLDSKAAGFADILAADLEDIYSILSDIVKLEENFDGDNVVEISRELRSIANRAEEYTEFLETLKMTHDSDSDNLPLVSIFADSGPSENIFLSPDEFDRFVRLCESETPHEVGERLREAAKRLDEEGFDVPNKD